jgi:hypothetical protein
MTRKQKLEAYLEDVIINMASPLSVKEITCRLKGEELTFYVAMYTTEGYLHVLERTWKEYKSYFKFDLNSIAERKIKWYYTFTDDSERVQL